MEELRDEGGVAPGAGAATNRLGAHHLFLFFFSGALFQRNFHIGRHRLYHDFDG